MGQAKKRGTYEERKASAIKRNEEQKEKMKKMLEEIGANMTPEERKKRNEAKMVMQTMNMMGMNYGNNGSNRTN